MDKASEIAEPTTTIELTILGVEAVNRGKLFALISAEINIEGIAVTVHGIQALRDPTGARIEMPMFRDDSGRWRNAITLPEEIKQALATAVLDTLAERGLAKGRLFQKEPSGVR